MQTALQEESAKCTRVIEEKMQEMERRMEEEQRRHREMMERSLEEEREKSRVSTNQKTLTLFMDLLNIKVKDQGSINQSMLKTLVSTVEPRYKEVGYNKTLL